MESGTLYTSQGLAWGLVLHKSFYRGIIWQLATWSVPTKVDKNPVPLLLLWIFCHLWSSHQCIHIIYYYYIIINYKIESSNMLAKSWLFFVSSFYFFKFIFALLLYSAVQKENYILRKGVESTTATNNVIPRPLQVCLVSFALCQ